MKKFEIRPRVEEFTACEEFVKSYAIGADDLMVISRHTYEKFFAQMKLQCQIINPRDFGSGEPSDEMAEAMYQAIQGNPGRIIAIGGGTVLDISKLFALKYVSPISELFDGKLPLEKDKELILVPTTCGTGSEVTNISILELKSRGTKKGLAVPQLYGDVAVLIPELLQELPFRFFATSSIDALIHSIESSLSPKASDLTKLFGYRAMEMILRGYQEIRAHGEEARIPLLKDFLTASTYAGIAFGNAGCGAVHALSYPLGATFHVAHGEANYAIFTGVMKNYMELKADGELAKLNRYLAEILGCEETQVYEELDALLGCLLPKRALHEYGMTEEQIDLFTDSVLANQQRLLGNNFVPFDRDRIRKVYRELY